MLIAEIYNDKFTAHINEKGAELSSLVANQTEYIWQANPEFWARHTPVLFPIVGKLNKDQFLFEGKTYSLSQHGFARDMDFEIIDQSSHKVTLQLLENEQTLKKYPFKFNLQISYELDENGLTTQYKVLNTDEKTIYFSIGGHPALNCPFFANETRNDYELVFEKSEIGIRYLLKNGVFDGSTEKVFEGTVLPITENLFDKDALVFQNLQSQQVTFRNKNQKDVLTVKFPNFQYLGIWSKSSQSPFVCIEPWFGLADLEGEVQEISQKTGIQKLEIGESFECAYYFLVH